MIDSYNDRWALITGASSGIGAEFATQLAGRGMHLILAARRKDKMAELATELNTRHGTRCHIVAIDLSDPESSRRLFEEIKRLEVNVELLVNNAGIGLIGQVESTSPEDVRRLLHLNLLTLADLTYRVLPGMLSRGHGAIINMSSQAGRRGEALVSHYCASKAAVISYTQSAALAMAPHKIRVNSISPGVIDTPMWAGVDALFAKFENLPIGEKKRRVGLAVPMGYMGDPKDIAGVAVFLASDDAGYITAQTLNVDGGSVMS